MERREDEVRGPAEDNGRDRNPVRLGASPEDLPREVIAQTPRAPDSTGRRSTSTWVNWQSALYLLVLGLVCLVLVPLTPLWWIVPVLGVLAPLTLAIVHAVLDRPDPGSSRPDRRKEQERELLEALAERGEITPTTAAMRTSLTVDQASQMLDELAGKGHLKFRVEGGVTAYSLRQRDRLPAPGEVSALPEPRTEGWGDPKPLDDPLSERELEVLTLLASGRTNAEIARELVVAVGTVKSHVNSIYRKLDAANRAEAVTRARDLGLLR